MKPLKTGGTSMLDSRMKWWPAGQDPDEAEVGKLKMQEQNIRPGY